jgi:hypothetical protein
MAAIGDTPVEERLESSDQPPAPAVYEDPVDPLQEEVADPTAIEPEDVPATMPEIEDPEGEIEELEDRSMPIERVLWATNREGVRIEKEYIQQGLMWFGKIELYGLLGQAVRVVLEGDNPLGIGNMLDMVQNPRKMMSDLMGTMPGADDAPDRVDVTDDMEVEAGKILAAFAEVVAQAPQLLSAAYCIVLNIPKTHRNWAVEWAFPNMDDEMGKDILHTFIDQNWGVMEDFFAQELPKIVRRIVKARSSHSAGRR